MKKGFTLIELLAVIVILAVISLVTVPIIGNIIEDSKKKSLEQSVYGIVEAANYFVISNDGDYHFIFSNEEKGIATTGENLSYKGNVDANGDLYIDNEGNISLCLMNENYYVYKNYNSGIYIGNVSDDTCIIGYDALTNKYIAMLDDGTGQVSNVYSKEEVDGLLSNLKAEIQNDYVFKSELETTNSNVDGLTSIVANLQEEQLTGSSRNSIYKEENITSDFNDGTFSTNVANGSFKGIQPGAYITGSVTVDGTSYDVTLKAVDLDLYYGGYDSYALTSTHHVAFLVLGLLNSYMNDTDTTAGGFKESYMYTTYLPKVLTALQSTFGAEHFVSHATLITNSVNSTGYNRHGAATGASDGWEWVTDQYITLPTEMQMYGGTVWSSSGYDTGEGNKQFAATQLVPYNKVIGNRSIWFRDVTSSSAFAGADYYGYASYGNASYSGYIAPLILLK